MKQTTLWTLVLEGVRDMHGMPNIRRMYTDEAHATAKWIAARNSYPDHTVWLCRFDAKSREECRALVRVATTVTPSGIPDGITSYRTPEGEFGPDGTRIGVGVETTTAKVDLFAFADEEENNRLAVKLDKLSKTVERLTRTVSEAREADEQWTDSLTAVVNEQRAAILRLEDRIVALESTLQAIKGVFHG